MDTAARNSPFLDAHAFLRTDQSDFGTASELGHKRRWDQRRSDLQAVEGVQEIIEIFQDEMLAHAYRRRGDGWIFELISGPDAEIALPSIGITFPLVALYEGVVPEAE